MKIKQTEIVPRAQIAEKILITGQFSVISQNLREQLSKIKINNYQSEKTSMIKNLKLKQRNVTFRYSINKYIENNSIYRTDTLISEVNLSEFKKCKYLYRSDLDIY